MEKYRDNLHRRREIVNILDSMFLENMLPGSPTLFKCVDHHFKKLYRRKCTITSLLVIQNFPDDIINIILQEELYYLHLANEGYSLQEDINKYERENYEKLR